jgi:hypothetical protein
MSLFIQFQHWPRVPQISGVFAIWPRIANQRLAKARKVNPSKSNQPLNYMQRSNAGIHVSRFTLLQGQSLRRPWTLDFGHFVTFPTLAKALKIKEYRVP